MVHKGVVGEVPIWSWVDEIYSAIHEVTICDSDTFIAYAHTSLGLPDLSTEMVTAALTLSHMEEGTIKLLYWFHPDIQLLTDRCMAIITHEAFHGTQHVMAFRQVPQHVMTAEPWAYYLDTVFSNIVSIVRKQKASTHEPKKGRSTRAQRRHRQ